MYKIIYKDDSIFHGGDMINSKWNEINKPIKKLIYIIGNKCIKMVNFEKYNHLIEHANKVGAGDFISKVTLMGLKNNTVTKIIFNFNKHTIEREEARLGYEYNGGLSTGWKKGIDGKIPSFNLLSKAE